MRTLKRWLLQSPASASRLFQKCPGDSAEDMQYLGRTLPKTELWAGTLNLVRDTLMSEVFYIPVLPLPEF